MTTSTDRTDIKINSGIALELKKFCLEKHGTCHGTIKAEAEAAIQKHIHGG
jgi:hypothetical protein